MPHRSSVSRTLSVQTPLPFISIRCRNFFSRKGTRTFAESFAESKSLVRGLSIPVIVKEIGAGISKDVAQRLISVGVAIIDVAGAGGTSWAGVEILRRKDGHANDLFWDWGIPTSEALRQVASLKASTPGLSLIASGGMTNGLEAAKAFALGADVIAAARPMLKVLMASGKKGLSGCLDRWINEFKGAMFLVGAATLKQLRQAPLVHV